MFDIVTYGISLIAIIVTYVDFVLARNAAAEIQERAYDETMEKLQSAQRGLEKVLSSLPAPDPYVPFDPDLAEIEAIVPEFTEDQLKWKKTL